MDYRTYNQMHPDRKHTFNSDIGPEIKLDDSWEPDDTFFMCLPTQIPGFNMQKKEWGTWYWSIGGIRLTKLTLFPSEFGR